MAVTKHTSLRISPEVKAAAELAARDESRTLTSLVEHLLREHCIKKGFLQRPSTTKAEGA